MNFRSCVLLVLLALMAQTTSVRAANEVTQIKLQHTKCYGYGGCPVDELTLNADGSAEFAGDRNSAREGFYRGKIAPEKFAALVKALEEQNFFELRAEIGSPLKIAAPDALVSATRAGSNSDNPYTVIFQASGNWVLLNKLQIAFAEASAQIEWQKDEIASKSGARGTLKRDLTKDELRLFAKSEPPLTSRRLRYALVKLIKLGEDKTQTVYATRTDREGKYQIFAPPGRYLFSVNDINAAYLLEKFPYYPRWLSNGITIEVKSNQFLSIEMQLRDFNKNTAVAR